MWTWQLGTRVIGGLGSAWLRIGLGDLGGLCKPHSFCNSMMSLRSNKLPEQPPFISSPPGNPFLLPLIYAPTMELQAWEDFPSHNELRSLHR